MKILEYLNIYDYYYEPTFLEDYFIEKNYTYIWLDTSRLASFYKIKTIDGIKKIPIITEKIYLLKMITNLDIIISSYKNRKRIYSETNLFSIFKCLPSDIIKLIVSYGTIFFQFS